MERTDRFYTLDVSTILPREKYTIVNPAANEAALKLLTSEQTALLISLQTKLQQDFPEDVQDTAGLVRFLKARKWDVPKAEQMFRARMKWVNEFQPHKLSEEALAQEIKKCKAFLYGRDNFGRPVMYVRAEQHVSGDYKDVNDVFKAFIFASEIAHSLFPLPPYDQFVMLHDRRYAALKNIDTALISKLATMADYYPEYTHSIIVYGSNWLFHNLFKLAKKIMDPVTIGKVNILPSDEKTARPELAKIIPTNMLLPDFGGDSVEIEGTHLPRSSANEHVYRKTRRQSMSSSNNSGSSSPASSSAPSTPSTTSASPSIKPTALSEEEKTFFIHVEEELIHDTSVKLDELDLD